MRRTSLLLLTGVWLGLVSCGTVPDRKAGGAAFDDSYIAQRLDSNRADLESNIDASGRGSAPPSFQQWREGD